MFAFESIEDRRERLRRKEAEKKQDDEEYRQKEIKADIAKNKEKDDIMKMAKIELDIVALNREADNTLRRSQGALVRKDMEHLDQSYKALTKRINDLKPVAPANKKQFKTLEVLHFEGVREVIKA